MSRTGIILQVDTAGTAVVSTRARGFCTECAQRSECGVEPGGERIPAEELTAVNTAGGMPGDRVELELPGHTELTHALVLWGIPLVGLLAGAVLASAWLTAGGLGSDAAALAGAGAGFALGFVPAVVTERRMRRHPVRPIVKRVLGTPGGRCRVP